MGLQGTMADIKMYPWNVGLGIVEGGRIRASPFVKEDVDYIGDSRSCKTIATGASVIPAVRPVNPDTWMCRGRLHRP